MRFRSDRKLLEVSGRRRRRRRSAGGRGRARALPRLRRRRCLLPGEVRRGVCSGTWDVACFLEHLCISSLARLFMVLVLIYITLFFVYLMCKVGIIQCIVKSTCKMAVAACSACWHALGATSCFLWRKLRNTKRVHRGRRRDVEKGGGGFSSSSDHDEEGSSFDDDHDRDRSEGGSFRTSRTRGGSSVRERRKGRLRRSLRLRRLTSKEHAMMRSHGSGRHHHHRVGLRRIEASSSSLRVHGEAMARRGRARIHRADEG